MADDSRRTGGDAAAREEARLSALAEYEPGSGLADAALDELVVLAAQLCGTPMALVTLIGADRQDFAASFGTELVGTARDVAFCAHAIESPGEALIVPDATSDPRFASNPLVVGDPGIRFYAGIPLVGADQQALGTLCVIDHRPRELSEAQLSQLRTLSRAALAHLEARRARLKLDAKSTEMASILSEAPDAFIAMNERGRVEAWNPAAERLFGWTEQEALGRKVSALIIPTDMAATHDAALQRQVATGEHRVLGKPLELPARHRDGSALEIELTIGRVDRAGAALFTAFARDISARKLVERELERERRFNQAVLETIDTPVVACDADGDLTLFNRAARDLHGVNAVAVGSDEWASRYDLFEADGQTPMAQERIPLARAFVGEEVSDQQMVVHRHGLEPRTLSASGRQIRDADGGKIGAVVAMHDLTDRLIEERARREADQLFRTAFDAAPIGMVMVAPDGRLLRVNAAISDITGYSKHELEELPPFHFVHPQDADEVRARFGDIVHRDSVALTHRILRADGEVAWVEAQMTMLRAEDGTPRYALAQVSDISERHLVQQRLGEQHAFISAVVETADSLVIVLDRAGRITTFNRACEALTGRTAEEVDGRFFWEVLIPDNELEATRAAFGDIVAGDFPHHYVNHWRTASGDERLIEWRSTALTGEAEQITHIIGTGIDVTERKRFEDQLRHLAEHDSLTGLVNRRRFESGLETHIAHCQRYGSRGALLLLDIDKFKAVNDTLGHSAGDELIVSVATTLREHLRESDTVARLGGDEFAVLLPEADRSEAWWVAEKVVQAIREHAGIDGDQRRPRVTTSVGVHVLEEGVELDALQVNINADRAMYSAKRAGGDRCAMTRLPQPAPGQRSPRPRQRPVELDWSTPTTTT